MSNFIAVYKEDISDKYNWSALELYLYCGIKNLTNYSGAFVGNSQMFRNYFNLNEVDGDLINKALTKLVDGKYITITKNDGVMIMSIYKEQTAKSDDLF